MPDRGGAPQFRRRRAAAELLGVDLLADVVEEENLKRTGEGCTGHPVPIIAGAESVAFSGFLLDRGQRPGR